MKLLIMKFSPTSRHFLPLPSKYSPQYPYKTTDKVILLYILIFKFLEKRREDKRFGIQ
jgi:hypothetical protein